MSRKMVQYSIDRSQHGHEEELVEKRGDSSFLDWLDTLRSLRVELRSFKDDNERIVKAQENQDEMNVVILQSLSYLQRQKQHEMGARYKYRQGSLGLRKQELNIDGAKGSRSKKRHKKPSEDTVRGGIPLSTP